jgi:hypothetical protein
VAPLLAIPASVCLRFLSRERVRARESACAREREREGTCEHAYVRAWVLVTASTEERVHARARASERVYRHMSLRELSGILSNFPACHAAAAATVNVSALLSFIRWAHTHTHTHEITHPFVYV